MMPPTFNSAQFAHQLLLLRHKNDGIWRRLAEAVMAKRSILTSAPPTLGGVRSACAHGALAPLCPVYGRSAAASNMLEQIRRFSCCRAESPTATATTTPRQQQPLQPVGHRGLHTRSISSARQCKVAASVPAAGTAASLSLSSLVLTFSRLHSLDQAPANRPPVSQFRRRAVNFDVRPPSLLATAAGYVLSRAREYLGAARSPQLSSELLYPKLGCASRLPAAALAGAVAAFAKNASRVPPPPARGFEGYYPEHQRSDADQGDRPSSAWRETPPQPVGEGQQQRDGNHPPQKAGESSRRRAEEAPPRDRDHPLGGRTSSSNESSSRGRKTAGEESSGNNDGGAPPSPSPSSIFLGLVSLVMVCGIWNSMRHGESVPWFLGGSSSKRSGGISIQEFFAKFVSRGFVQEVRVVNRDVAHVVLRPEAANVTDLGIGPFYLRISSPESFEARLEAFQQALGIHPSQFIPVRHVHEIDYIAEILSYIPTLLVVLASYMLLRRLASFGAANDPTKFFKLGRAQPVNAKDIKVKVKFCEVAGMREAKHEIQEFVDFLKAPRKYEQLGAHIPKGALLVGPPGTGKTLLAKAVAGEANVPFYSISGSDFIEVFVGVGPSRVRDLFAQARKNSPSIIFIDEIDAVGRKRAKGGFAGGANDERENTLNQMLVEMDGFTNSTGVVVLAGTNRADILDPALTRPGRFDRTVHIEKPDLEERTEIFKIHMAPLRLHSSLEPSEVNKRLAALTPGFVGADIQNVCNEAAIYAARRSSTGVELVDFENACERVIGGMKKSTGFINPDLRRVIAFHEAGHAVAGWFLKYADPMLKVSIVPRTSGALGFAQHLPDEIQLLPKQQILDKIAVLLGGRVSEELHIGRISTGASDDLDKVTKLAYAAVAVWGFNQNVGLVSFQQGQGEQQFYKPYSEHLAQQIDSEVRDTINAQYERVKKLLMNKKDLLEKLSTRLLSQETISFADLTEVLGARPWPIKQEYQQYVEASPTRAKPELPGAVEAAECVEVSGEPQQQAVGSKTVTPILDAEGAAGTGKRQSTRSATTARQNSSTTDKKNSKR